MNEDNRELDLTFAEILAELHALRVIVNEAFSIVLARDADPANAVVAVRKHLTETERAETMAIAAGRTLEFRQEFARKLSASVNAQLDAIEKRVSQLMPGRATH